METIFAASAPKAVGPYCHAIKQGGLSFTSGQIALDPETGKMVNGSVFISNAVDLGWERKQEKLKQPQVRCARGLF